MKNEKLFLNSNFYIRGEADTDLFANFLAQIWTLFWKLSKDSYFSEWQCQMKVSSCWHQFTNWWTILYGFGWWHVGEMHWLWMEISCILCDNLLDFEKETLDHLELQGFFTCCMEKWFSYLITSIPQIYLNNRYCCVCFGFVIKIDLESCQGRWCYTEHSIYQHSPVTEMEGNEVLMKLAAQSTLSRWPPISCPEGKWTLPMKLSAIQCNQNVLLNLT